MTYADEPFYNDNYLLGRKPVISAGFDFYARASSRVIDLYTFNRIPHLTGIPESVRMCCCELSESEFRKEKQQRESGGKTSEKVGSYSVSFAAAQESAEAASKEQRDIIMKWLGDTGLCYKGV